MESPSAAIVLWGDAKLKLEGDIGQILQLGNHWNSPDFQIGLELLVRSNAHVTTKLAMANGTVG